MNRKKLQTPLANDIDATNSNIRYDTQVKTVLADKNILARILKYTVEEFSHLDVEQIKQCIEGIPEISCVAMEPGLSNAESITGQNTEDAVPNEGKIFYDIKFYAILPNQERTKLIINVEAQNSGNPGYDLVTRALFYCARALSAQLDKEFSNKTDDRQKYDGIKKVYSIWICMNSGKNKRNSIIKYSIEPSAILGQIKNARYDIMTAVMIYLGGDKMESDHELIGMLTTLLSSSHDKEFKKKTLQEKYHIPMSVELEQEVDEMCNLSQYVEEKGIEQGEEKILALYNWLINNNRMEEATLILKQENKELRKKLYSEFDADN